MTSTMTARLVAANLTYLLRRPQVAPIFCSAYSMASPVKPMHSVSGLMDPRCHSTSWMICAVPLPVVSPTSEPTWPRPMTKATAEIQPVSTGAETKSRRKPSLRRPMTSA